MKETNLETVEAVTHTLYFWQNKQQCSTKNRRVSFAIKKSRSIIEI